MFSIVALGFLVLAALFALAVGMSLRGGEGPGDRFALARVVADAMTAIGRAPILLFALALATAGLPALLTIGAATGESLVAGIAASAPMALAIAVFDFAWYQLGTLAMIAATLEALEGRVDARRVAGRAIPAVPAAMIASVVYWLAVGAGFLFFAVPGAIIACVWMLVLPPLVAERAGPFAALARSARLTRGIRWQLFLLAIVGLVFGIVVQAMLGGIAALLGGGIAAQVVFVLASSLLSVLPPALVAAAYRAAVAMRDGPSTRELEQVFA